MTADMPSILTYTYIHFIIPRWS